MTVTCKAVVHKTMSPPHEVLQYGALPGALPADHRYLRQVQVAALADGAEGVLELVDERNQLLHPAVPHRAASRSPKFGFSCVGLGAKQQTKFPEEAPRSGVPLTRSRKHEDTARTGPRELFRTEPWKSCR